MNTTPKITINRLTSTFVEIDTDQYIEINGQGIKLDQLKHSVSYMNSPLGREQLQSGQPENIVESVLAIWGEAPTTTDPQPEQFEPLE